jgi:hypothetical protein
LLRYIIEDDYGAKYRIKYLTWDQSKRRGPRLVDNIHGFLDSDEYFDCEPLFLKDGDWNHATIFFSWELLFEDEDHTQDDNHMLPQEGIVHDASQYERIVLPTLSPRAIWTEKPSFEWADLNFTDVELRGFDEVGMGIHPHRGRLRVVTHEAIGDSKSEMVM